MRAWKQARGNDNGREFATHLHTHDQTSFAQLGVREEIVRALAEQGIEHAFAIQELTLPLALAGDDLIGQARTGMGKTFAFGIPCCTASPVLVSLR